METDRLVRKAGKTFTTWRPWLSIKPSANLAGLLALPCRIAEFSCVPPHNEEGKTVDPDELSTTNTKLLNNYFWQMVIWYPTWYLIVFPLYSITFPLISLLSQKKQSAFFWMQWDMFPYISRYVHIFPYSKHWYSSQRKLAHRCLFHHIC